MTHFLNAQQTRKVKGILASDILECFLMGCGEICFYTDHDIPANPAHAPNMHFFFPRQSFPLPPAKPQRWYITTGFGCDEPHVALAPKNAIYEQLGHRLLWNPEHLRRIAKNSEQLGRLAATCAATNSVQRPTPCVNYVTRKCCGH